MSAYFNKPGKMKQSWQRLIEWLLAIGLLIGAGQVHAERVLVVQSEAGGVYKEFADELGTRLRNSNIDFQLALAGESAGKADLYVAIGLKALTQVALAQVAPSQVAKGQTGAVLSVLVPRDTISKILQEHPSLSRNGFSAIYLDQPYQRQLDLVAAALPHARSLGVLHSGILKDRTLLRQLAAARKLELVDRELRPGENLATILQAILLSSDVLLAVPDTEIYNSSTIRNILLATYRNKVPLIGFSAAYVKAGALLAVFSTPDQVAEQSFALIESFLDSGKLPQPHYARNFEVMVNERVANSLGLDIKSAQKIRKEIGGGS